MPDSSLYSTSSGGALKFKGSKPKKKKSSSSSSSSRYKPYDKDNKESSKKRESSHEREERQGSVSSTGGGSGSGGGVTTAARQVAKTKAELALERAQLEKERKNALKTGSLTHKDRVDAFNDKLEQMSEHHDIPKVGPG